MQGGKQLTSEFKKVNRSTGEIEGVCFASGMTFLCVKGTYLVLQVYLVHVFLGGRRSQKHPHWNCIPPCWQMGPQGDVVKQRSLQGQNFNLLSW